jgi:hypothetical protein
MYPDYAGVKDPRINALNVDIGYIITIAQGQKKVKTFFAAGEKKPAQGPPLKRESPALSVRFLRQRDCLFRVRTWGRREVQEVIPYRIFFTFPDF